MDKVRAWALVAGLSKKYHGNEHTTFLQLKGEN